MSTTASPASGAASLMSTARQRTHVAREEWEETWVAGQRAVTDVIDGQKREKSLTPEGTPAKGGEHLEPVGTSDPGVQHRAASAHAEFAEGRARASGTVAQMPPSPSAAVIAASGPSSVATPLENRSSLQPGSARPPASSSQAQFPMESPRSFALWRDGAAIDLSMRLKDASTASEIVEPLRRWLRDGGSYLRKLVVNGVVEWQQPDIDASARERPPARKLNRHI